MGSRIVLVLAFGFAACGPIAYVNEVTRHADDAVEAARRAQADKLAPYWWTRATQYLHKARENAARADFQGANRFGRLASEAAEKAIVEAKDPTKQPIDLNGGTPGKDGGLAPAKGGEVAPAKDGEEPVKTEPAPAKPTPVPAKTEPAPAKPTPVPAKAEPAPAKPTPVPAKAEPAPAKGTP
jgi:hypothetical protein